VNRILGVNLKGGSSALAVVVALTVTCSVALELTTKELSGSFVLIAQVAFGAFVEQEK
jgi:hypothetical protein